MKKKVLSVMLAATMVFGLTACGGSQENAETNTDNATATASNTSTDEEVSADTATTSSGNAKLTFSWWGNQTRNERTQAALDLYSEQNPGITFDTQPAEWNDYWTKLSTAAAGNTLPECLQMDYSYLAQYVASDLLVDLTPYVENGTLDVSNVDPGILESGSIDGKLYAVCAGVNAPSLLYNKTLTDSLGLEIKDNMTLDEFYEIANKIYTETGIKTDLPYEAGDNYLPFLTRADGVSKLFNEDSLNVDSASALEPYFSVYEKGITQGWVIGADVHAELTSNSVEQSPLVYYSSEATQSWCGFFWSNQLSAMVAAANDAFEVGITTWPSLNPKNSNFLKPSQFFAVSRDAGENEEEAVKVLNYMLNSEEANKILLGERGVPASSVVASAIAPLQDETAQVVTAYINDIVTPNCSAISPAIPDGANEVYDYANQLVDKILYKEISAADAAEELFHKGNEIMAR